MSAFQSSQVSVSTTATELVSGLKGRYQITVTNLGGVGYNVWLGGSGVTTSDGYQLFGYEVGSNGYPDSLATITMDVLLDSSDALYAVAASGASPVDVAVLVNPR